MRVANSTATESGWPEWVHKAFQAVWPVLSVILVITILLNFAGSGLFPDINIWPTTKALAEKCGDAQYCPEYLRIAKYYSIVAFGTAAFLFLNALNFIFSVQQISIYATKAGIDSDWTRDLGLYFRVFALLPNIIWLIKIVAIPEETFGSIYVDEILVLSTFFLCTLADASILFVLWRQKDGKLWMENREFFGALCYIDIPTLFGVYLIIYYAPSLLDGAETPGFILKALSGGALIIHVVTSQIILSFLITEVKFSDLIERHWQPASNPVPDPAG